MTVAMLGKFYQYKDSKLLSLLANKLAIVWNHASYAQV